MQKNAFDAAILDFQLPEADGLSLAQEIRELSGGRSLRLLLLTSVHLRAGDPRAGECVFRHPFINQSVLNNCSMP